jgi:hypothetical protein
MGFKDEQIDEMFRAELTKAMDMVALQFGIEESHIPYFCHKFEINIEDPESEVARHIRTIHEEF